MIWCRFFVCQWGVCMSGLLCAYAYRCGRGCLRCVRSWALGCRKHPGRMYAGNDQNYGLELAIESPGQLSGLKVCSQRIFYFFRGTPNTKGESSPAAVFKSLFVSLSLSRNGFLKEKTSPCCDGVMWSCLFFAPDFFMKKETASEQPKTPWFLHVIELHPRKRAATKE